jgi:hypothetical protein
MYNARAIILACLCCIAVNSKAQYTEMMRTLRPGFTVSPWTVGDRVFQVHVGFTKGWGEKSTDGSVLYHNNQVADLNLCLGLGEKFELEAFGAYKDEHAEQDYIPSTTSGFNMVALGGRYNIRDGGLNGFSAGLQGLLKFPVQSTDFRVKHITPRLLLLLGFNPGNIITLTGNIGLEYDGKNDNPTVLYGIKSAFMLSGRLGCFIEAYNNNLYTYKHLDIGMYLYATNNFQLDISTGLGFRKQQYDSFFSLGLSYRFANIRAPQGRWIYGEYR